MLECRCPRRRSQHGNLDRLEETRQGRGPLCVELVVRSTNKKQEASFFRQENFSPHRQPAPGAPAPAGVTKSWKIRSSASSSLDVEGRPQTGLSSRGEAEAVVVGRHQDLSLSLLPSRQRSASGAPAGPTGEEARPGQARRRSPSLG